MPTHLNKGECKNKTPRGVDGGIINQWCIENRHHLVLGSPPLVLGAHTMREIRREVEWKPTIFVRASSVAKEVSKETDKPSTTSAVASTEERQEEATTESIVQELLAQGLTLDQIVMPGGAKGVITYMADDFDAPLDDFEEYL